MVRWGLLMQQDILIIGVLFPAIPLMMVNFGNRFAILVTLIRHLHDEVIRDNVSPNDAERFHLQINWLHDRLRLIGIIQSCAAISFVLALGMHVSDLQSHQEWEQYQKPKRRRRTAPKS